MESAGGSAGGHQRERGRETGTQGAEGQGVLGGGEGKRGGLAKGVARLCPDAIAHAQKEKLGMIDGLVRNIAANSSASPGGAGWGVEGGGLDAGREGDGIGTSLGLKVQDQRVKYAPSLQPLSLYGNACVHSLAGLASEVCSPCIAPLAICLAMHALEWTVAGPCWHLYLHICMYMYTYLYLYLYLSISLSIYLSIYLSIHICICMYIYIYMYIYIQ